MRDAVAIRMEQLSDLRRTIDTRVKEGLHKVLMICGADISDKGLCPEFGALHGIFNVTKFELLAMLVCRTLQT